MILERTFIRKLEIDNNTGLSPQNISLKMHLDATLEYSDETEKGINKLKLIVKDDKEEQFDILVEMYGIFRFDKEENVKDNMDDFSESTRNIMYPYLTAYIATLLPLSGLSPLYLPQTLAPAPENE